MPTFPPRLQVTVTPDVARALHIAEESWPDLTRAERIKQLLARGAESLSDDAATRLSERARTVRDSSGALTGLYSTDYRQSLRDEWPV